MVKETKKPEIKKKANDKCTDITCPIHGNLKVRGRTFKATVVKAKMKKTVVVEWSRKKQIPKY